MTGALGYTHALFGGVESHLRTMAIKYDKKENGGNENGLLDGNEIAKFSDELMRKTNIDFNSLGLKQSVVKTVKNEYSPLDGNKTIAEKAAEKYRAYNTNSTSIFALNDGNLQKNEIKVSYLSNEDYNAGRKALEQAGAEAKLAKAAAKEKENNSQKSTYESKDTFSKFISWIIRQFK